MRKFINALLLCLFFSGLLAQKHDYVWLFGYGNWAASEPDWGGSVINFNSEPPEIYKEPKEMNFEFTGTSICDTSGNLVLYTNGIFIANYLHQKIPGSDTLNPGPLSDDYYIFGYPVTQGAIILPSPKEDSVYYVFHETVEYSTADLSQHGSGLYYTVVDMRMNDGTGGILEKRVPVVQDTLLWGKFSATKHANGRDWWLMVPEYSTNRYYRILLDPSGVQVKGIQAVGTPAHPWEGVGQAAFSPDGSKFARYNAISLDHGADLDLYSFDRCTGLLDNLMHLTIKDSTFCGGVAFSPNSRYMYVSSTFHIYQFDMEAEDIWDTKDTVAVFDGFIDPFYTVFWLAQLAPDGKIYIIPKTAVKYLHVIHHPDEPGEACEVEQHAIKLPTLNAWTMPNFPNYRLGALEGSPCDTLTTTGANDLPATIKHFTLSPNPAREYTTLQFHSPLEVEINCRLFNDVGQIVLELNAPIAATELPILLEGLAPGIYFVKLAKKGSNNVFSIEKLVITK